MQSPVKRLLMAAWGKLPNPSLQRLYKQFLSKKNSCSSSIAPGVILVSFAEKFSWDRSSLAPCENFPASLHEIIFTAFYCYIFDYWSIGIYWWHWYYLSRR